MEPMTVAMTLIGIGAGAGAYGLYLMAARLLAAERRLAEHDKRLRAGAALSVSHAERIERIETERLKETAAWNAYRDALGGGNRPD